MKHEPGIDGHGLFVLAWCSCGYNRTAATRGTARRKLDHHIRVFEEMDRRLDARLAANFAAFHASAEEPKNLADTFGPTGGFVIAGRVSDTANPIPLYVWASGGECLTDPPACALRSKPPRWWEFWEPRPEGWHRGKPWPGADG